MTLEIILYDPKDPDPECRPRHEPVIDAKGPRYYDHEDCPEHGIPSHLPCAACNWRHPTVVRLRRQKRSRLDKFIASGKLPAAWLRPKTGLEGSRIPKPMTDEEARKVVLPRLPAGTGKVRSLPEDKLIDWVCTRYLEAMGEKAVEKARTSGVGIYGGPVSYRKVFGCGCEVEGTKHSEWCRPCEKHARAFEGTGED